VGECRVVGKFPIKWRVIGVELHTKNSQKIVGNVGVYVVEIKVVVACVVETYADTPRVAIIVETEF
jgi:hypothetical protein